MRFARRAALIGLLVAAQPVCAITIEIINRNVPGVGFNDPGPANPAAGANGATTLGAQRLAVIEHAAGLFGRLLRANADAHIKVSVQMVAQPCGDDGTTLASAGPVDLAANFPNAPRANTAYHIAHANALAGHDLVPERDDINANFNLSIDSGCSSGSVGWWYGFGPAPADRIVLLNVALHELAHGLGFSAQMNLDTGEFPGSSPPVWFNHLYDLETMKHWRSMTTAERVVSARNDPYLVWSGEQVRNRGSFLEGAPALKVKLARGLRDDITELGTADFGGSFPDAPMSARVVLINDGISAQVDGSTGTIHDGCEFPFVNGSRLAGRIAMIDRGLCTFVDKALFAQQHGAVAVIIVNNQVGAPPGMSGADTAVTIPLVSVTRSDGARMKRSLVRPQLVVEFGQTEEAAGTTQGCVRMFAPEEAESGSSVSHFHRAALPDLLMEPSLSRQAMIALSVDLTVPLLADIGWGADLSGGLGIRPLPLPCAIRPLP